MPDAPTNDNGPGPAPTIAEFQALCGAVEVFQRFLAFRVGQTVVKLEMENAREGWSVAAETVEGRGYFGSGATLFAACQDMHLAWAEAGI